MAQHVRMATARLPKASINVIYLNKKEMSKTVSTSDIKKYVVPRNNSNDAGFTKWTSWTQCEHCMQSRSKKCITDKCKDSTMYELRPCQKKRCKRKNRRNKEFHVVQMGKMLKTKSYSSLVWTRWSKWSDCNEHCKTQRYRICRKPSRCNNKKQKQTAFCFHEKTRCEHLVLNLIDHKKREQEDNDRYSYNKHDNVYVPVKSRKCGRPFKKTNMLKIIGGIESKKHKWPWHVAVLNRFLEVFCAGTLIAPRWVLTAGHCVRSFLRVRLNEHDLISVDGSEVEMTVQKMFLHPRFNHQTVDNDIALLRLPKPVKLPFACLPSSRPITRDLCSVMGWGKIKSSDVYGTTRLHEAKIPVVNTDVCTKAYRSYLITRNMFCAGWTSGAADTCAGDSGGGLMCPYRKGSITRTRVFTIQGITSFGDGCGRKNKYGIYTMVYNYLQWINYIMDNY